jgi:hypothetical protein
VAVTVGLVGALGGGVVVRAVVGGDERITDVPGRRLPRAVIATLLHPPAQLLDARGVGVIDDRRGLRDGVGVD